jgi:hypothetical protein
MGSHTTEDGEEVDVLWYQYDDPATGDVCIECGDIECGDTMTIPVIWL